MDATKRQQQMRRGVTALRHQFAQGGSGVFSEALAGADAAQVIEAEAGDYRDRHYPPLTTLRLFVGQVLSEDGACQDVVGRHLSERVATGQPPCGLNTGPYCQARQRLPLAIPQRLSRMVGERLESRVPNAWCWRRRHVKLFDGTTISMPDTPENQRAFPQSSEQKPGLGFPVARIGGLISLASGAVLGHAVAACKGKGTGEQTLLRGLLPLIAKGDILLADALLATWWIVAEIQRRGGDVVMVQQGRRVTDFAQGRRLGQNDHVVEWPLPQRPKWMSLDDYARCPMVLRVREVEVDGRILITTLLDPKAVTPRELDTLYALRWNIEVDWRTIKVTMAMDVLRCRSPEMIEKEIAVHLLAYNLVRWTMASAAWLGDVLPRCLSFTSAKRVLLAFGEQLRHCVGQRLSFMFATVLAAIADLKIPHRPGRFEPRAKKRRPKPLPLLTVPRHIAREKIREQRIARGLIVVP
jgi:hypothetical protein